MEPLTRLGRYFFAAAAAGAGARQLATAGFVRLVPAPPGWLPWPAAWAVVSGALLVLAGMAILTTRWARPGAVVVATLLLSVFVVGQLPAALSNPSAGFMWTNPSKALALFGGALLAAALPGATDGARIRKIAARVRTFAWVSLAVFLVLCGAQHFVYAGFVDTLVPGWIPPGRRFWTVFAGGALLAGGLGLAVRRTARTAALLSGLMVFLWVFLVHLPRAVTMKSIVELDGVFEALALSGVAIIVAGTAARPASPDDAI
jgi:uncharacterized membrane protein